MPATPSYQRLFAEFKRRHVFRVAALGIPDPLPAVVLAPW
jgi:hypothetical protein